MRHGSKIIGTLISIGLLPMLHSCDSIDCTLENHVIMTCNFYQDGNRVALSDTLHVTALGTDSVLVNRELNAKALLLPLSYFQTTDTIVLRVKGKDYEYRDTLWINKKSRTHFESPDCPVTTFHELTDIQSTHVMIDSITITHKDVNYASFENIQIHFYPSAD